MENLLQQAKMMLQLTKEYKESMYYCEGKSQYMEYKQNGGTETIQEYDDASWLVKYLSK